MTAYPTPHTDANFEASRASVTFSRSQVDTDRIEIS